eukprot:CAMPEP_0194207078 /NCGR_PEP_ID=MMETSP0156-20130528/5941_1 /TAXON_ID=33649 /ORGANISM="Thalassionema nitzschioides, Strain L26-B" /LENGTH=338 /DNA_ID=CAMNT_0038933767 /DNA_START=54 /DNA_END=1070 /DNA_ORIENTATION=-
MTLQNSESLTSSSAYAAPKPMKKRTRCLRADEAGKWNEHFRALMEFKMKHNHCIVPHTYSEDPGLGRWVKRQRYQYKCLQQNKKSSMMPDRVELLEKIGFVWDPHEATWKENLEELIKFKEIHGNCDVPYYFNLNPQLATWVTRQRRQYTLYNQGKNSSMTPSRIATLEGHGFKWNTRVVPKQPDQAVSENLVKLSQEINSADQEKNTQPCIDLKLSLDWQPESAKIFSKRKEITDRVPLNLHQMPLADSGGGAKFTDEDGKMLLQVLGDFDDDSVSLTGDLLAPSKKARFDEKHDSSGSINYHEDILSSVLSDLSDDESISGSLDINPFPLDMDFIH